MISTVILTKNEAIDLPGCLQSLTWCQDVHVLDSFSTDTTVPMARAAGAQVHQRPFDNFANQRNAGLRLEGLKFDWILFLDADERVSDGLAVEILRAVGGASSEFAAFQFRRKDYFMGRWLKHAQMTPYYIRLVRRRAVRYERAVNEVVQVEGRIGHLAGHLDHYPFSKGLAHWIAKHNEYSTMEAALVVAARRGETKVSMKQALFGREFHERRWHQKNLFYRMPARPLIKLAYLLVVRGAILDGRAGLRYALLQAIYEWWIELKAEALSAAVAPKGAGAFAQSHCSPERSTVRCS